MAIRMQQRRGTSEQWTNANPVLGEGELGWESDTNKFKIGDGVNQWGDLAYFLDEDTLEGAVDDFVPLTAVGVANGVASLDSTGNVPANQLGNVPATDLTGYATETYVGTQIANLVDSAPGTLDTLNELAAALGDDSNFATTVTNAIAGKADSVHTHVAADISNISAAMKTFLTSPTSSNLASAVTGETGSGDLVFSTSPALSQPSIVWPNLTLNPTTSTTDGRLTRSAGTLKLGMGSSQSVTFTNDADLVISQSQVTDLATDLSAKASSASPTFTGTVVLPNTTSIGDVSATELGYLDGVTSAIQTQLDGKAASSHTHGMSELTEFEISSPANGQTLSYNGTKWVNSAPQTSGFNPFLLSGM